MKNKLTDFEKEKKQLRFTRTKEFILLLLMTLVTFAGFMIILIYLIYLIH